MCNMAKWSLRDKATPMTHLWDFQLLQRSGVVIFPLALDDFSHTYSWAHEDKKNLWMSKIKCLNASKNSLWAAASINVSISRHQIVHCYIVLWCCQMGGRQCPKMHQNSQELARNRQTKLESVSTAIRTPHTAIVRTELGVLINR